MQIQDVTRSPRKPSWGGIRKNVVPKPVGASSQELVKVGSLEEGRKLPLLVEPSLHSVDLFSWAANNQTWIEEKLLDCGGILFRGFGLEGQAGLSRFLEVLNIPLMHYIEGATPRTELGSKVYTSTEFPADQTIALHNELCYVSTWPMKIFFFSDIPALEGGETPIADVRGVLKELDPDVLEKFREKGWMLVRNFGDGFGPEWRVSYRVSTKAEVEKYLAEANVQFTWKGSDRLRTRQVRPAIRKHPVTAEEVWFNHIAFWHVSSLAPQVREMFLDEFEQEDLPYNTYYGDGTPIPDSVAAELRRAYQAQTVSFLWQRGDLLMLDNMLVAHGRFPFKGERRTLTSMGEPSRS